MHIFKRSINLPININTAWDFFSSPNNLKKITPPKMGFIVTSGFEDNKMYPGIIICYKVKPILNIPVKWVSEIRYIEEKKYFVDEQRFGPYKFWHHKHFFRTIEGGVEMTDIIHYKLPFGFIGKIVNALFVQKQIDGIFDYREKVLKDLFGKLE